jgi:hypothetical protein
VKAMKQMNTDTLQQSEWIMTAKQALWIYQLRERISQRGGNKCKKQQGGKSWTAVKKELISEKLHENDTEVTRYAKLGEILDQYPALTLHELTVVQPYEMVRYVYEFNQFIEANKHNASIQQYKAQGTIASASASLSTTAATSSSSS